VTVANLPPLPDLPAEKPRRPLRPLHGIPEPDKRSRAGWWVSGLLHAIIIAALILPPLIGRILEETPPGGAGGPGPAGGGGGGTGGTGGQITPERIRYLQVQGTTAAPTPPPPVPTPTPTPTPVPPPPPEPQPEPQAAQTQVAAPAPAVGTTAPSTGTGGGSGTDGSGGNGPGSGGGVGSGVGTGRGSGMGPGTGGGGDGIYPPQAINLPVMPIPVPNRIRPYRMVAQFDVDERGNARLIGFNPSSDRGYNNKLREVLSEVRFRPATRADGTPVRDTAQVVFLAP
jgi:protein TonB